MKADHKIPEVLTRDHAVSMLPNQDEVGLEGPATRCQDAHGKGTN